MVIRFPAGERDVFQIESVRMGFGMQPACCLMEDPGLFAQVRQPGRETEH